VLNQHLAPVLLLEVRQFVLLALSFRLQIRHASSPLELCSSAISVFLLVELRRSRSRGLASSQEHALIHLEESHYRGAFDCNLVNAAGIFGLLHFHLSYGFLMVML
jgi:hypothetical protein